MLAIWLFLFNFKPRERGKLTLFGILLERESIAPVQSDVTPLTLSQVLDLRYFSSHSRSFCGVRFGIFVAGGVPGTVPSLFLVIFLLFGFPVPLSGRTWYYRIVPFVQTSFDEPGPHLVLVSPTLRCALCASSFGSEEPVVWFQTRAIIRQVKCLSSLIYV